MLGTLLNQRFSLFLRVEHNIHGVFHNVKDNVIQHSKHTDRRFTHERERSVFHSAAAVVCRGVCSCRSLSNKRRVILSHLNPINCSCPYVCVDCVLFTCVYLRKIISHSVENRLTPSPALCLLRQSGFILLLGRRIPMHVRLRGIEKKNYPDDHYRIIITQHTLTYRPYLP